MTELLLPGKRVSFGRLTIILASANLALIAALVFSAPLLEAATTSSTPIRISSGPISSVHVTSDGVYAYDHTRRALMRYFSRGQEAIYHIPGSLDGVIWSPNATRALLLVVNNLNLPDSVIRDSPLLRSTSPNGATLTWLWIKGKSTLHFLGDRIGSNWTSDGSQIVYTPYPWKEIRIADPDRIIRSRLLGKFSQFGVGRILFSDGITTLFLSTIPAGVDAVERLRKGRSKELAQVVDPVAASPSGKLALAWVVDRGSGLNVIDVETGARTRIREIPGTSQHRVKVTWIGDSHFVVAQFDRDGAYLWRFTSNGQAVSRVLLRSIRKIEDVIASRDGKAIYLTSDRNLYRTGLP